MHRRPHGSKSLHNQDQATAKEHEPQGFRSNHDGVAAQTRGSGQEKIEQVIAAAKQFRLLLEQFHLQ